ncbi:hypothetical protein WP3W19E03_33180 [Aeromonas veronii]|uniref:Uncharacterized protein n=1 Tax=Aeromonas veronii TaxID=654 RepID=A0A6S5DGY3_AERVE|nr:hypothetical protein [Aeromonas veronii]BBR40793.1 hypothetical protein WP3W19E03_33180 [Aeromonas veronii]
MTLTTKILLLLATLLLLALSGWQPYDRATWLMEVAPVIITIPLLLLTHRTFPLTSLLYPRFRSQFRNKLLHTEHQEA